MAKQVELPDGSVWPSKKAATEHFRQMLGRYKDGDVISDFNDHSDLVALLERYDTLMVDGPPKIGPGIDRFERRLNRREGWSSSGFWVVRVDGSATDFSYPSAVAGIPKQMAQELYNACHNAVARDLLVMKQNQFDKFGDADGKLPCDVTGELIAYAEAHLAHANPPFGAIVNGFRQARGWETTIPSGLLSQSGDAQLSSSFTNNSDDVSFRNYHHSIATMRIVSKARPAGSATMVSTIKKPLRFM